MVDGWRGLIEGCPVPACHAPSSPKRRMEWCTSCGSWDMGQWDGSHGSWSTKHEPLSSMLCFYNASPNFTVSSCLPHCLKGESIPVMSDWGEPKKSDRRTSGRKASLWTDRSDWRMMVAAAVLGDRSSADVRGRRLTVAATSETNPEPAPCLAVPQEEPSEVCRRRRDQHSWRADGGRIACTSLAMRLSSTFHIARSGL